MKKSGSLLIFLSIIFSITLAHAFDFTEGTQFDFPTNELNDLDDVTIETPIDAQVLLYNDSSNSWYNSYLNDSAHHVNASDYWITGDRGSLRNVADILHNWLDSTSLLWSNAGHIIDTSIEMNSKNITNASYGFFEYINVSEKIYSEFPNNSVIYQGADGLEGNSKFTYDGSTLHLNSTQNIEVNRGQLNNSIFSYIGRVVIGYAGGGNPSLDIEGGDYFVFKKNILTDATIGKSNIVASDFEIYNSRKFFSIIFQTADAGGLNDVMEITWDKIVKIYGDLSVDENITAGGIITGDVVVGEIWKEGTDVSPNATLNVTTPMEGNVSNLTSVDMSYTLLDETVGDGFEQIYNYTMSSEPGSWSWIGYYFPGNIGHGIDIESWNGTGWEIICADVAGDIYTGNSDNVNFVCQFPSNSTRFLISSIVQVRAIHDTPGSNTHIWATDAAFLEPKDITFDVAGVYYPLTGLLSGICVNTQCDAQNITIEYSGIYKICTATSFKGTPEAIIHGDVFQNGNEIDKIAYTRKLGSGGDIGSAGMCGLYNASVGDKLNLKFKSDVNNAYVQFENANFNIQRLN
jgi:hypothetical protein